MSFLLQRKQCGIVAKCTFPYTSHISLVICNVFWQNVRKSRKCIIYFNSIPFLDTVYVHDSWWSRAVRTRLPVLVIKMRFVEVWCINSRKWHRKSVLLQLPKSTHPLNSAHICYYGLNFPLYLGSCMCLSGVTTALLPLLKVCKNLVIKRVALKCCLHLWRCLICFGRGTWYALSADGQH